MSALAHANSGGAFATRDYDYNAIGLRTVMLSGIAGVGSVLDEYVHDPLDQLARARYDAGSGTPMRYDVYGLPTILDASGAPLPLSAFGNPFLFTGREWIPDLGLYDYRNRVYSPALGRWLQRDPIGFAAGDLNLYCYVANSPDAFIDPSGLITIAIPGVGPQADSGGDTSNEAFIRGVRRRDPSAFVFQRNALDQAIAAILRARETGDRCVTLYGYSRGAVAAIRLAALLEERAITVNKLITLDPVVGRWLDPLFGGQTTEMPRVPANVEAAFNFYQRGNRHGIMDYDGRRIHAEGSARAYNLQYPEGEVNGYPVVHQNVPSIFCGVK